MASQPLHKKRKVETPENVWNTIYTVVGTIQPLASKIIQYKQVLKQISRITGRVELENICKPGQRWDELYVWTKYSADTVKDFILMWWDNLRKRWKDLDEEEIKTHTEEENEQIKQLRSAIFTELRRWKRLIRCKDEDLDVIESKTVQWVEKFTEKWSEINTQYTVLESRFVSIFNTYSGSKITTESISKKSN
tara:strand:- start:1300 stop:1878 length:579 start_codon:yes stop_codon:yes gene_type:complete